MNDKYAKRGYLPGIDGLRALAVLAVITYHAGVSFMKGGFIGVDVFFVISGFVIAKSLESSYDGGFRRYIAGFYKRRVLRIFPALIVCLLLTVAASVLFIPPSWMNDVIDKTGLYSFLAAGNFALLRFTDGYFGVKTDLNPFLHTWSLGVEEQFYLFFPLVFFLYLKFGKRESAAGLLFRLFLPALAVLSFVFCALIMKTNQDFSFYMLPARFWELAAGSTLYQFLAAKKGTAGIRKAAPALTVFGMAAVVFGILFAGQNEFPFPWAIVPVSGTLCLIAGIVEGQKPNPIVTLLGSAPAAFIGRVSYSLYLWHWPVLVLMRWTCGFETPPQKLAFLFITIFFALASYYLVENPIRRNRRLQLSKSLPVVIGGTAILFLSFGFASFLVYSRPQISLSVTKDTYVWHSWAHWRDRPEKMEIPGLDIDGRKLFALGDSHTAAYRTMLNIVSRELGFEVHEYEQGGSGVLDFLSPMASNPGRIGFFKNSISEIGKLAKPGDILFLSSLRMPTLSDRFGPVDIDRVVNRFFSREEAENRKLAFEEADKILNELHLPGVTVIIEAPLPILKAPPFRCSDWFNKDNPIAANGLTIERDLLISLRGPAMESINKLLLKFNFLEVWDPFPVLCKDEVFSAYDENGLPIFYDGDHLSGNGNRLLAPSFRDKLLSVWTGN